MDLDKFRSFVSDSGVDLWTWIDTAISVASVDHEHELRNRRDGIVQRLYASTCVNCVKKSGRSDCSSQSLGENEDDDDLEQKEILEIKNLLDDHAQNEKCLISLLQRLVDMNTSFTALKETEIGRHVTKLRKHSSNEVRRLVKILVRKWKDTVDEWVMQNTPVEKGEATDFNGKTIKRFLPISRFSVLIHGTEKKQTNIVLVARDESFDNGLKAVSCHPTPTKRKAKDNGVEIELSDQESQHAKKQRKPQAMDISKLKNSIVPNNGGSLPVKYW